MVRRSSKRKKKVNMRERSEDWKKRWFHRKAHIKHTITIGQVEKSKNIRTEA
jgi:hypothetical protein